MSIFFNVKIGHKKIMMNWKQCGKTRNIIIQNFITLGSIIKDFENFIKGPLKICESDFQIITKLFQLYLFHFPISKTDGDLRNVMIFSKIKLYFNISLFLFKNQMFLKDKKVIILKSFISLPYFQYLGFTVNQL